MKRIAKDRYHYNFKLIYPITTLFRWLFCEGCKQEFRRERGWEIFTMIRDGKYTGKRYVCKTCATTKTSADKIVYNSIFANKSEAPNTTDEINTNK